MHSSPFPRWLLPSRRISLYSAFICALLSIHAATAQSARRTFSIPASDATISLDLFSDQADTQVVYLIEQVRGVTTNAVKGEFLPKEALGRLLAGTGLVASEDSRNGALAVKRASPDESSRGRTQAANRPVFGANGNPTLAQSRPASASPGGQSGLQQSGEPGSIKGRVLNTGTGRYLNNARVSVKGTSLIAFTDESGSFRLSNVPAGALVLEVFHTGLDLQQIPIDLPAGGTVVREVNLGSASFRDDEIVKLETFEVTGTREFDPEAIAINEQRFAPNIKNVVAAGSFGDIAEGNVGEFMKYLPGVTTDFANPTIISISFRGLPSHLTTIMSDGAQMANAHYAGSTRVFQFDQVSINNIARIEMTKVPTPSQPADSLGGTVNMVSKSAFEHKDAQLNVSAFLSANEDNLTFEKIPHSYEKEEFRVLPNLNLSYTLPVNDKFGIVVSALSSNQFNEKNLSAKVFATSGAGTGASPSKPFLRQHILQDSPKYTHRNSASFKADWRITPNAVLSASIQANQFWTYYGNHEFTTNVGALGTPAVASGTPLSYGPDYTIGATGRGAVTMRGLFDNIRGNTTGGNLRYRLDDGTWRVEAGVNRSASETRFRDTERGHFYSVISSLQGGNTGPIRVTFTDVTHNAPGGVQVFNNKDEQVDIHDIENYRVVAANSQTRDIEDEVTTLDLSIRRQLHALPFHASVQVGASNRLQDRDKRRENINWTYNGPDGLAGTPDSPALFAAQVYANRDSGFGFKNLPWASPHRAWQAFQQNPTLFTKTPAQIVAEETFRINQSETFSEEVFASFFQFEAKLFDRLNLLTGVRYEKTTGQGEGALFEPSAVYLRNPDGSFARNGAGKRIRKPEAGAVNSIEQLRLTRFERGARAKRSYDDYYPSVHLTYNVTGNFLSRLAYSKTYGRPNFNQIIPNATINEFDEVDADGVQGAISVRNPGLLPWSADSFDISLEYYTDRGGLISGGAFLKKIDGFFSTDTKEATAADLAALDLDDRYVGWLLTRTINGGSAELTGVELNVQHSLGFLGEWGGYFDVFANGTKTDVDTSGGGNLNNTISESANWGLTFRKNPVTVMAKMSYRGLTRGGRIPALGPDAIQAFMPTRSLDLNIDYRITRRLTLFANARNALNEPIGVYRSGSETPDYAKQFRTAFHGAQYAVGIKGRF